MRTDRCEIEEVCQYDHACPFYAENCRKTERAFAMSQGARGGWAATCCAKPQGCTNTDPRQCRLAAKHQKEFDTRSPAP